MGAITAAYYLNCSLQNALVNKLPVPPVNVSSGIGSKPFHNDEEPDDMYTHIPESKMRWDTSSVAFLEPGGD